MTKLEKLRAAADRAEAAFVEELKREYPVGQKVTYRLRGGKDADRYPWQEGEIAGHTADGRLRVKLAPSRTSRIMGYQNLHTETLPFTKVRRLDGDRTP